MDLIIVALIGALAFLWGEIFGFHNGRIVGRSEEAVRRRIAELPKPWERTR
jgi:hypothetical protein